MVAGAAVFSSSPLSENQKYKNERELQITSLTELFSKSLANIKADIQLDYNLQAPVIIKTLPPLPRKKIHHLPGHFTKTLQRNKSSVV